MTYNEYKSDLERRYWEYWRSQLRGRDELLRALPDSGKGPPVFRPEHRRLNVITEGSSNELDARVRGEIPPESRHRWFGSFHSSQALAQSVFANLKHHGKLALLAGVRDDDGSPVFEGATLDAGHMSMEHTVHHLGERSGRSTEVDVFFDGPHRVSVECKFTETEIGSCSRPRLTPRDANFERDHCDGSFTHQRGRSTRCSLSEIGVRYWRYLPELLGWPDDADRDPCPLRGPYQLVRNVFAACVSRQGALDPDAGHAVMVYDARNPHFQPGGAAFETWSALRADLRSPSLLKRCSWQQILAAIREDPDLRWLSSELEAKTGL